MPVGLQEVGSFTEEQRALAQTVRAVVDKRADSAAVRAAAESARGYDAGLWSVLCNQVGVAALAIPEEYGGIGASLVETHLVCEELGRGLVPSPLLGSVVLGAQTLLAAGDTAACAALLPGIADGSVVAALCWSGAEGRWDTDELQVRATASGSGWSLSGTTDYVLGGDHADVLLVIAAVDDGPAVFQVDPSAAGVGARRTPTMDVTRPLARVSFADVPATRLSTGAVREPLQRMLDAAAVALSGEQVGAASRLLQLTVDYTKERKQFGRAIGSFQALKHRMADLYVQVETARSISYSAAQDPSPEQAALARVYCTEVFEKVAGEAIQLHGGIAITWEHDAHLYFKRAHGSAQLFGPVRSHLRRLESAAGLRPVGV